MFLLLAAYIQRETVSQINNSKYSNNGF